MVRSSFVVLIFTIPLEAADIGLTSGRFSVAKLAGLIFFACYCFYYNSFAKRRFARIPYAMWWFTAYLGIYAVRGLFVSPDLANAVLARFISFVQLLVLMWLGSDLQKNKNLARMSMLSFCVSGLILAVGSLLNLPGFSATLFEETERLTSMGYDPNKIAIVTALPVVILIGLYINGGVKCLKNGIVTSVLMLPLLILIVRTGSRTGMVSLLIGFAVYLLPYWKSRRKMMAIGLVVLGICGQIYFAVTSPVALSRWQETIYEASTSGRDQIISEALGMIIDRPIFGWGPGENWAELSRRLGRAGENVGPHSLYVQLLIEEGIVGAFPFFVGLLIAVSSAWKCRNGYMGMLPLATLATLLIGNMGVEFLTVKPLWFILGLSQATAFRPSPTYLIRRRIVNSAAFKLTRAVP
jgi:O-antigen ligase